MKNFFPVFRPGTYTDSEGKTRTWTKQMIQELYENYDPAWLRAAFSTDHKQDGPAMGYAKNLKLGEDGTLYADPNDLAESLREEVKKKHFGRVSVEIAKLGEKGPYLKGISFLGVKMPAVKGMETEIQDQSLFEAADEVEQHVFETSESEDELFSLGDVVEAPDEEVGTIEIEEETEQPADEPNTGISFTQKGTAPSQENFDDKSAEIARLEAEKTELESRFEQSEAERKQAQDRLSEIQVNQQKLQFEGWLNERIAYGSVMPRLKDQIMNLLLALESVEMFSEGEAEAKSPVEMFQEFVNELPPIVDSEELVKKGEEQSDMSDPAALAGEIVKYQAQILKDDGRRISVSQALKAIQNNQNQK